MELDGSKLQSIKEKQLVHVHTVLYFSSLFLIKKIKLYNTHLLLLHDAFGSYQFLLWSCSCGPFPFLSIIFFLINIFATFSFVFMVFLLHYWSHYFAISLSPRAILRITYLNSWELEVCVETVIFYLVFFRCINLTIYLGR